MIKTIITKFLFNFLSYVYWMFLGNWWWWRRWRLLNFLEQSVCIIKKIVFFLYSLTRFKQSVLTWQFSYLIWSVAASLCYTWLLVWSSHHHHYRLTINYDLSVVYRMPAHQCLFNIIYINADFNVDTKKNHISNIIEANSLLSWTT